MKEYLKVGAVILVAAFVGAVGAIKLSATPQLAGDFPGGILPTQLVTGNDAAGYAYPVGSLAWGAPNGLYIGGLAAANELTAFNTAVTNYPVSSNVNLGSITAATSTTSTVVAFSASGFSVGDACEVSYNGTTSTSPFGADSFITAVNGSSVSATVTFWNGATSLVTLTPTSSATGVSSTLKVTCFHTGV